MRILLTNLFLQGYTGSESYIYTLGKELRDLGHTVTFYTHNWGWFGNQVRKEGFECWYNPNKPNYKLPHTNFDVVHFQHRETVARIFDQVKHIPKMFISHGILPDPEQALPFSEYPMQGYAGVSEETLENCIKKANPETVKSTILRNLIDTDKYKSENPIKENIENVLIISNYMQRVPEYIEVVQKAVEYEGAKLTIIGDAGKRVPDTRPYIEKSDIVIGLGRCAYEAMSMGRNVLVFDYQGCEGMIKSDKDYFDYRAFNLSGRFRNCLEPMVEDIVAEFFMYDAGRGYRNRKLIEKYHDSKVIAKEAELFYNSL